MNPLPEYYELLANAWAASEEVDMFDVVSNDPQSAARFTVLLRESAEAQMALINYVAANADTVRQALDGSRLR